MGMRVGGSNAGWASYQTSSVSGWQQRQQGMKDLMSALKTGDLASAQQAFAGIKSNANSSNSALSKVGDALQAGDLAGAQQAAQAMHGKHGGHHRTTDATQGASSPNTAASTGAGTDATAAFNSFIQNLEAALQQQGQTTAGANGQGSFLLNMPPPPAAVSSASAAAPGVTTTQDFLSSRTSSAPTNAQIEASLESLIQQMSGAPGASPDATSQASSTASTNNNLQKSFANLMGALGGQSSSASVTNFLQSMDNQLKSMDAAGSSVNATA